MADTSEVDLGKAYVYCVTCGQTLDLVVMNLSNAELQLGVRPADHTCQPEPAANDICPSCGADWRLTYNENCSTCIAG